MARIFGGSGGATHATELSPGGACFLDVASRVDVAPVAVLRCATTGRRLLRLADEDDDYDGGSAPPPPSSLSSLSSSEQPPPPPPPPRLLECLAEGDLAPLITSGRWQRPLRFCAPGRDGKTPVYGVLVFPPPAYSRTEKDDDNDNDEGEEDDDDVDDDDEDVDDDDEDGGDRRGCPVVEQIYAGPHDAFCPKAFALLPSLQALAARGFVAVMVDGEGTNRRGRRFLERCWRNLADAGLPDHKRWLRAAAARAASEEAKAKATASLSASSLSSSGWRRMDLARGVGIIGGSAGGQSVVRALLDHDALDRAGRE